MPQPENTQRRVDRAARRVEWLAGLQAKLLAGLIHAASRGNHWHTTEIGDLMARTQQELLDEIAGLKSAIQADNDSDQQVVTKLDGVVTDLKSQLSGLQSAGVDTDALFTALEDAKSSIKAATSSTGDGTTGGGTTQPGETGVPTQPPG